MNERDRKALADELRSAAAWLRVAADRLEAGNHKEAADMAELGWLGAEDKDERIRRSSPTVLTRKQAAEYLQVSTRTLDRRVDEGRIRHSRDGRLGPLHS